MKSESLQEVLAQIGPNLTDFPKTFSNPSAELTAGLYDHISKYPQLFLRCVTYTETNEILQDEEFVPFNDTRRDGDNMLKAFLLMNADNSGRRREVTIGLRDQEISPN